jgi:hypothetical protein
MIKIKDLIYIGVIVLLSIFLWKSLKPSNTPNTNSGTVIDTTHVTIIDSIPVPYFSEESYDSLYSDLGNLTDTLLIERYKNKLLTRSDSFKIAKEVFKFYADYNTVKAYNDTLQNDSIAFAVLYEEVYRNAIQNRKFHLDTYNKTIYPKLKSHLYLNTDVGYKSATVGLSLIRRDGKFTYNLGYDVYNNGIRGGVGIRLY